MKKITLITTLFSLISLACFGQITLECIDTLIIKEGCRSCPPKNTSVCGVLIKAANKEIFVDGSLSFDYDTTYFSIYANSKREFTGLIDNLSIDTSELQGFFRGCKGDSDSDPTNELLTGVSLNGTTLTISDTGNTYNVDLSSLNTDDQQILNFQLSNTLLRIELESGGVATVNLNSLISTITANNNGNYTHTTALGDFIFGYHLTMNADGSINLVTAQGLIVDTITPSYTTISSSDGTVNFTYNALTNDYDLSVVTEDSTEIVAGDNITVLEQPDNTFLVSMNYNRDSVCQFECTEYELLTNTQGLDSLVITQADGTVTSFNDTQAGGMVSVGGFTIDTISSNDTLYFVHTHIDSNGGIQIDSTWVTNNIELARQIPETAFADVTLPTDAEAVAWVAANSTEAERQNGIEFFYNVPDRTEINKASELDPDFRWEVNILDNGQWVLMSGQQRREWFVDSRFGNDSYNGRSEREAFKTLAKLEEVVQHDDIINLARNSYWREGLDLALIPRLKVRDYGTGKLPIIDGSDIITTGFTQVAGTTNVWEYTIVYPSSRAKFPFIVENGCTMLSVADLATADATPGSFVAAPTFTNYSTWTIQFHPSDSGDPNANGLKVEIPLRITLYVGENSSIEGVHLRNSAGKDGLKVETKDGHEAYSIIENSAVHAQFNSLGISADDRSNGGSVENLIALNVTGSRTLGSSTTFVSYQDNANGLSDNYYNCWSVLKKFDEFNNAYFSHGAGNAAGPDSVTYYRSHAYNSGTHFAMASTNGKITIRNSSGQNIAAIVSNGMNTQHIFDSQFHISGDIYYSTRPADETIWRNIGVFVGHPTRVNTEFVRMTQAVNWDINNLVYYNLNRRDFMLSVNPTGTLSIHKSVFFGRPSFRQLDIPAGVTYTGDYNIFCARDVQPPHGGTDFISRYFGTTYTTLAAWQAATGQDMNSVYLTAAQMEDFFLGDPRQGDFRVNPYAEVTGGDGTIYKGTFPDGTPLIGWELESQSVGVDHSHFNNSWIEVPMDVDEAREILSK